MANRTTADRTGKKPAAPGKAPARVARPVKRPPAPASGTAAAGNGKEPKKHKLVRDSFTMPRADFELIQALKERALGFKHPAKKSELLRAGLQALAALDDAALQARLERLVPLKPGRPKKRD